MKANWQKIHRIVLFLFLILLLFPSPSVSGEADRPCVHVIAIDGEITPAMASYLEQSLEAAVSAGAQGVILDIRTLGGRVDAALKMRDTIITAEVPVVVFISSRAVSAGALIAIAADTIVMARAATSARPSRFRWILKRWPWSVRNFAPQPNEPAAILRLPRPW